MRVVLGCLVLVIACTKPNPNRCCTDEADCTAKGIPVSNTCDEGLLCRGNQCIAQTCTSPAQCDLAAPYCIGELCTEACGSDDDCPGFGESPEKTRCSPSGCVTCLSNTDCMSAAAPVCEDGSCRGCISRDECTSGVCTVSGLCALDSDIAHVTPSGGGSTDCSSGAPCTIARALALGTKKYILIQSGSYSNSAILTVSGERWLVGGGTRPKITTSVPGPVFRVPPGANVRFENLEIYGAVSSGTTRPYGSAIDGFDTGAGSRAIEILDSVLRANEYAGLDCQGCTARVVGSTFEGLGFGIFIQIGTLTGDRLDLHGNLVALYLYQGTTDVKNSFLTRNESAIELCYTNGSTKFEGLTIADSSQFGILTCAADVQAVFQNSIIARNATNKSPEIVSATFPGSIVTDSVTALKFKSPDAAPYDYHLLPGSSAVDQGVPSTNDHDFDGKQRPLGAAADVGAHEVE
jgi:hypothetical protein